MMFDQSFPVVRGDFPISLPFENVIFVMEDVDVASPIVRSRDRASNKRRKKQRAAAKALKAKQAKAPKTAEQQTSKHGHNERQQLQEEDGVVSSKDVDAATGSIGNTPAASVTPAPSWHREQHQQVAQSAGSTGSAGVEVVVSGKGDGEVGSGGRPARVSIDGDDVGVIGVGPAVVSSSPSPVASSEKIVEYAASESTDSFERVVGGVENQEDEHEVAAGRSRVHDKDGDGSLERGRDIVVEPVGGQGKAVAGVANGVAIDVGDEVNPPSVTVDPTVVGNENPSTAALVDSGLVIAEAKCKRDGDHAAAANAVLAVATGGVAAAAAFKVASGAPKERQNPEQDPNSDSSYYESSDSESDSSDSDEGEGYKVGPGGRVRGKEEKVAVVKAFAKTLAAGGKKSGRSGRKKYASKTDKLDLAVSCGSMSA